MNIGHGFKKVRFEKKLQQQDVAKKAKISQTYLSLLEGGHKKNPSQKIVGKLCKIYEVPYAIVVWMSVEESDIQKSKINIFRKLKPSLDEMINHFL